MNVGLLNVGNRFILQRVRFMEEETTLEVGKFFKLFPLIGQLRAAYFNVLFSTTYPSAFSRSQDVSVLIVLLDNVGFSFDLSIVPCCRNGTCHFSIALLLVVDVAFINANEIGIYVKVVCVIVTTVNVRHACYLFTT